MFEEQQSTISVVEISPDNRYGKFVWEPLDRGFGTTLGNSLRRVLMSSLPGAAVTSVRIENVLHEFAHIEGVREDITDIILNIKGICFKVFDRGPKILRLEATEAGEVTAGDIETGIDFEVLNPEFHIATLEAGSRLVMELTVESGYGYVSADKNVKPNQPIGVIPIDSIYSPIIKVNYDIADTRVGNVTDYDKLTMEVWTDGSIRPDEAMSHAANVLIERFSQVQNLAADYMDNLQHQMEEEAAQAEAEQSIAEPVQAPISTMTIDELDLSVRANNCLQRAGIRMVETLCKMTDSDLKKIRNLGNKSIDEIKEKLSEHGFDLTPEKDIY